MAAENDSRTAREILEEIARLKEEERLDIQILKKCEEDVKKSVDEMAAKVYNHLTVTEKCHVKALHYFMKETGWTGKLVIIAPPDQISGIREEATKAPFDKSFTAIEEYSKED